ncbi:MAG TPA: phage portal protein, partial [Intrasporangium sp.]|uniref:phage portal protein n=1 Tax=Intrasporangium sp. TaxID=1925024 RepID=UPI002F921357
VGGSSTLRRVTDESAPTLAPVYAALRHIVDFTSSLPVDAYQRGNGGKRTEIDLPRVFADLEKPGRQGLGVWIGQAAYGLAAHGNAVGWVVSQSDGFPTDVEWLSRTEWGFQEHNRQWTVNGSTVSASRIVHVPWIVPPGKTLGLSPIEHFAAIVRAGLSAQDYADVARGGGIPPAVLKNTQMTLNPDEAENVQSRVVRSFASGKPFVTGSDWDLSLLTIPPNHAQFIETLKLSASAIASIYGIDPREIGGNAPNGSITYSTDETRSLNRANDMRPYIVRMERAFARLLPDRQYVKLNVDSTIRTDIKTRVEVIGAQIQDGRLSVDEARALEDRTSVPGGSFHNVPAPKAEPTVRQGDTP